MSGLFDGAIDEVRLLRVACDEAYVRADAALRSTEPVTIGPVEQ